MRQLGRVGAEREATLPREFYMGAGALTPEHLHSLSFQILQIARLQPRRVLEVGIGNGFVSTYLRQMGIEVVTADINPALAPDVCAPLHELPERLAGQRFDVVSCCEVLEHMPFEQFDGHVCTLARLGTHALISLPGHWVWAGLAGRLGIHNRFVDLCLGVRIPNRRRLTDGHYWELDSQWATRRSAVRRHLGKHYERVQAGVFPMHRYHYFFRCLNSRPAA